MWMKQLSVVDNFRFHILVDVLSSRYKLDSYVRAFVQLVFRELNKPESAGI